MTLLRFIALAVLCVASPVRASEPTEPTVPSAPPSTAVAAPVIALPHAFNQSYIYLRIYENSIEGRLEMNLGDLNRAAGTTFRTDLTATESEVAAEIEKIQWYLFSHTSIGTNGTPLTMTPGGHSLYESAANQFVSCRFQLEGISEIPDSLEISHRAMFDIDTDHRGFVVIEHWFKQGTFMNEGLISLTFEPGNTDQVLDLTDNSVWHGVVSLMKLGMHHIWEGIDHVLFLLVLLLPSVLRRRQDSEEILLSTETIDGNGWEPVESFRTALWQVFKIVTVFTIAYSITLSLAALDIVQLPVRVVESIIALSIAVAAIDIIYPVFRGKILWIVFGFGLFHGFGFAFLLGEMGISGGDMAYSLLGFNGGVEIGQLAIVIAVFPFLFMMRLSLLYSKFAVYACALVAMLIALYWFVERAFEIDLPLGEWLGPLLKMF